ncbi:MAG: FISUMP domain-containing protein [Patescibacteria group bacterium]|jgi:uncharacterized protein (TIGR02145 family)|nr:FISUMP domain-containing protein [Patescibacteria group bacterium]
MILGNNKNKNKFCISAIIIVAVFLFSIQTTKAQVIEQDFIDTFSKEQSGTLLYTDWNTLLGFSTTTNSVIESAGPRGFFLSTLYPSMTKGQLGINAVPGVDTGGTSLKIRSFGGNILELFDNAGINVLRVLNDGKVGIGVETPEAKLHIQGSWANTRIDGDNIVIRKPNYTGNWAKNLMRFQEYTGTDYFSLGAYGTDNALNFGYIGESYNDTWMRFYPGSMDVVFDQGNVGIGVTNPTSSLEVIGHVRNGTESYTGNGYELVNVNYLDSALLDATSSLSLFWEGSIDGDIYSLNNGNIGIGVLSPSAKLQINPETDIEGLRIISSNFSPLIIRNNADDSDLMRVNQEGKVEIASSLKIANTSDACDSSLTGTFKYDEVSGQSYMCDGIRWINQRDCGIATDEDSNTYGTIQIGGQCWMAENINVGTMLASAATEPNTTDRTIEKWCYGDSLTNCESQGGLYNWNEAMRGSTVSGAQGICPTGWHIPTDAEINTLEKTVVGVIDSPNSQYPCSLSETGWRRCADDSGDDVGGTYGAGNALRQVGLGTGVGSGTDLVGWSGNLPGYRYANDSYGNRGVSLILWSSSVSSSTNAWRRLFYYSRSTVYRGTNGKGYGFSVRCLLD